MAKRGKGKKKGKQHKKAKRTKKQLAAARRNIKKAQAARHKKGGGKKKSHGGKRGKKKGGKKKSHKGKGKKKGKGRGRKHPMAMVGWEAIGKHAESQRAKMAQRKARAAAGFGMTKKQRRGAAGMSPAFRKHLIEKWGARSVGAALPLPG